VGVGSNDQHNAYDGDIANSFYNLATEVRQQERETRESFQSFTRRSWTGK